MEVTISNSARPSPDWLMPETSVWWATIRIIACSPLTLEVFACGHG
jgi:hypothetical protein